jgi:hypothetical protein
MAPPGRITTSNTTMEHRLKLDSLQLGGKVRRREAGWRLKEAKEARRQRRPTGCRRRRRRGRGTGRRRRRWGNPNHLPCRPSEHDAAACEASVSFLFWYELRLRNYFILSVYLVKWFRLSWLLVRVTWSHGPDISTQKLEFSQNLDVISLELDVWSGEGTGIFV